MSSDEDKRQTFDTSGKGGDASSTTGQWHGVTDKMTCGDGAGGAVSFGTGRDVPNSDFKMTGTGGNAQGNAGGGAKGGDGKGGSLTFN